MRTWSKRAPPSASSDANSVSPAANRLARLSSVSVPRPLSLLSSSSVDGGSKKILKGGGWKGHLQSSKTQCVLMSKRQTLKVKILHLKTLRDQKCT